MAGFLGEAQFRAALREAFRAESAVALTCVAAGAVEVELPPYRVCPSLATRAAFTDSGDVRVRWRHDTRLCHYEVKHRRKLAFHGVDDYPFPTVFVDSVTSLDAKSPRPDAYFICNAALDRALFISLRDALLETVTRFDTRYGQETAFYTVPLAAARSLQLTPPGLNGNGQHP